jgi:hypothetical protein
MLETQTILQRTRAETNPSGVRHSIVVRQVLSYNVSILKSPFQIGVPILSGITVRSAQQSVGADQPDLSARKAI